MDSPYCLRYVDINQIKAYDGIIFKEPEVGPMVPHSPREYTSSAPGGFLIPKNKSYSSAQAMLRLLPVPATCENGEQAILKTPTLVVFGLLGFLFADF